MENNPDFEYTDFEKAFLCVRNPEYYSKEEFKEYTSKLSYEDLTHPVFLTVMHSNHDQILSENDPSYNPDHANAFKKFGVNFADVILNSLKTASEESQDKLKELTIDLFTQFSNTKNFAELPKYQELYYIYENHQLKNNLSDINPEIIVPKKRI